MRLGWKIFLPLSLLWVVLTASYVVYVKDDGRIAKGNQIEIEAAPQVLDAPADDMPVIEEGE